jgi:hypothetical protein
MSINLNQQYEMFNNCKVTISNEEILIRYYKYEENGGNYWYFWKDIVEIKTNTEDLKWYASIK